MGKPKEQIPVHGVQHLNGDKHRQSHGHGMRIAEDLAVQALELLTTADASQMVSLKYQLKLLQQSAKGFPAIHLTNATIN